MSLSAAMQKGLNEQVTREFNAAYLYLAMSAWCAERNLDGFASWMRAQAGEEQAHALKILDFILDRGGSIALQGIGQPKAPWKSPLQVFAAAARHEAVVSGHIRTLYERALKEKDHATGVMLQWFITEQVEEEKTSTTIVERLKMVGDSVPGLLLLDQELGRRRSVGAEGE